MTGRKGSLNIDLRLMFSYVKRRQLQQQTLALLISIAHRQQYKEYKQNTSVKLL